jgi:hypothetical protein
VTCVDGEAVGAAESPRTVGDHHRLGLLRAENERLASELREVRALYRGAQQALIERDEQIQAMTKRRLPAVRETEAKRGWRAIGHGVIDLLEPTPVWRYGMRAVPGRSRLKRLLGL